MKIAYTSDLHLDFFFKPTSNLLNAWHFHFDKYFAELDSKTLIIAGDLSHFTPEQEVEALLVLKDWLNLENLIVVNGNHSGYRLSDGMRKRYANGLQMMAHRTDLMNANGIHALEGNYIEIDGIRIGGCDSFYDGTIFYRQNQAWTSYSSTGSLNRYWKQTMSDSHNMHIDDFHEYAKQQKDLLRGLKDQVDVMVTHVSPLVSSKFSPPKYQNDLSNAFYSFDFEEEIAMDTRLQYWVFGHTHEVSEYEFLGVKVLANPRGYPGEVKDKAIKHLEVIGVC